MSRWKNNQPRGWAISRSRSINLSSCEIIKWKVKMSKINFY